MAMTGVLRPGHISLRVLDLEEGINFYKNTLGLVETGRDAQGRVQRYVSVNANITTTKMRAQEDATRLSAIRASSVTADWDERGRLIDVSPMLLAVARWLPQVVGHEVPGQVAKAGRTQDLHPEPAYVAELRSQFA